MVPESFSGLADRDIGFVFRPFGLLDVSEIICYTLEGLSAAIKKKCRQEEYGLNIIEHKDISANVI